MLSDKLRSATQVLASGGWDVTTAVYSGKSAYVGGQESFPCGVCMSTDGAHMYIVGTTNDTVYQYTLSTPWDTATASYASKSYSVASQSGSPQDLVFKPDGSSMYIVDLTNRRVYQYSLSTPWDVTTSSYYGQIAATLYDTSSRALAFDPTGVYLYVYGITNDRVAVYQLGTAWDVTTSGTTYIARSGDLGTIMDSNAQGMFFKPDGTRMYLTGANSDAVYQLDFDTAWDVTGLTLAGSVSVVAQEGAASGLTFKSDGTAMYLVGTTNDTVYQYSLS